MNMDIYMEKHASMLIKFLVIPLLTLGTFLTAGCVARENDDMSIEKPTDGVWVPDMENGGLNTEKLILYKDKIEINIYGPILSVYLSGTTEFEKRGVLTILRIRITSQRNRILFFTIPVPGESGFAVYYKDPYFYRVVDGKLWLLQFSEEKYNQLSSDLRNRWESGELSLWDTFTGIRDGNYYLRLPSFEEENFVSSLEVYKRP